MARRIKSLQQNAKWGENRPGHREHRSKRGRNCWNKGSSEAYFKFKRKKEELSLSFEDKLLLFKNRKYRIK